MLVTRPLLTESAGFQDLKNALDNIGRRDDLVIMHADKISGVVMLNQVAYKKKMGELLSDGNTFVKVQAGSAK